MVDSVLSGSGSGASSNAVPSCQSQRLQSARQRILTPRRIARVGSALYFGSKPSRHCAACTTSPRFCVGCGNRGKLMHATSIRNQVVQIHVEAALPRYEDNTAEYTSAVTQHRQCTKKCETTRQHYHGVHCMTQ